MWWVISNHSAENTMRNLSQSDFDINDLSEQFEPSCYTNIPTICMYAYVSAICIHMYVMYVYVPANFYSIYRADSWLAPSQWETSLQSNAVSHWLGANLESALMHANAAWRCRYVNQTAPLNSSSPSDSNKWRHMAAKILVNAGSGYGLLPDGTKPNPKPKLTGVPRHPLKCNSTGNTRDITSKKFVRMFLFSRYFL